MAKVRYDRPYVPGYEVWDASFAVKAHAISYTKRELRGQRFLIHQPQDATSKVWKVYLRVAKMPKVTRASATADPPSAGSRGQVWMADFAVQARAKRYQAMELKGQPSTLTRMGLKNVKYRVTVPATSKKDG